MHHRARDISGMKLSHLTAVRYVGSDGRKSLWEFKCDCDKTVILGASEFMKNKLRSCGCMRAKLVSQKNAKHRKSAHPMYAVWDSMKARCLRPTHQAYHNYGGRGIKVCDRWLKSFQNFWDDMSPTYKKGLTIERIDVNGNYEPGNCTWTSMKRQSWNRRSSITVDTPWGPLNLSEAARRSGVSRSTLAYRHARGMPLFEKD